MKKRLNLDKISICSFVTEIRTKELMGASNCCLRDTDLGGNNCETFGHLGGCGSTGTNGDPTGMNSAICTAFECSV